MEKVVVINVSAQDLEDMIERAVAKSAKTDDREERLVTRDYLRINFGWSKYKINQLVHLGKLLKREVRNAKTDYFLLTDCEVLRKNEFNPNN